MNVRFDYAVDLAKALAAGDISSENRDALLEHLACNRSAHSNRLAGMRQTMAGKNRGELFASTVIQKNGATLGWRNFKDQIQNLCLQLLKITNRMHEAADL